MKIKQAFISSLFALGILAAAPSQAVPILAGITTGPDSSFSINFSYTNDSTEGEVITQLTMDGSTATSFPILWDGAGSQSGQTATVSGVDTQFLTFDFTSSWDPGEAFGLSGVDPDGDPGPLGVTIGQLAGVMVGVTFDSGASASYVFVDDPAPGAGLTLQSVPAPSALMLLGLGLIGLGLRKRA